MNDRDPRIEAIGRELCSTCKHRLEAKAGSLAKYNEKVAQAMMSVYAMRALCNSCKQKVLQGAARVYGR